MSHVLITREGLRRQNAPGQTECLLRLTRTLKSVEE